MKGLTGKLFQAEGGSWTGETEKYFVLMLDKPVCAAETSSPVPEIQVIALDTPEQEVKKLVGKRATISGLASTAATIHDHRPVVVSGKLKAL